MQIGMLGLGRMGHAISQRLIDEGCSLIVWNRTPSKAQGLIKNGARFAASPSEVASTSDIIFSILTDVEAIEATYSGPNGALTKNVSGKLFIDMSTVRPHAALELGAKINAVQGEFLECPVGGTVGPARHGQLFGFVGGSKFNFDRAKPVLDKICRRVEHVGEVGSGASVKLAVNLPLMVYWQALSEAVLMGRQSGISPERLIDILVDTAGAPAVMKFRGSAVITSLSGGNDGPAHFTIDSIRKDMRSMIEEAKQLGYDLPTTKAALSVYDNASNQGLGEGDGTELAKWWLNNTKKDMSQ